jgi:molecular chaperone HtpG
MTLLSELKGRQDDNRVAERLFTLANDLRDAAAPHLKRIIAQLPEYDLHDEGHAIAVIRNIETLLADKLSLISSYELFLLFAGAYVHDLGMALPDAESRLLELTEGTETFGGKSATLAIRNDLKPPWKLADAVHFIASNATELYDSFDSVKRWPFAFLEEKRYREDLAQRLVAYQMFRNGYAAQMRKLQKAKDAVGYHDLSEQIRHDFIRETHHIRSEVFARNLGRRFEKQLGGAWGGALAADLGRVCRSHGEPGDRVLELDNGATYLSGQTTNLAFVTVLLRIADVMHYSYDRAPKTLHGEKMFRSITSFKHWAVKNEGVNVSIEPNGAHGTRQISFRAFCREPEYYYILHSYIDAVDRELALLMRGIHEWRRNGEPNGPAERYDLGIAESASRGGVRPDESVFTPKQGLSFTLDQRRILDLLTGVGLYKDKYACIRELYQNSLDACRCMLASKASHGDQARGEIEFGIVQANAVDGKEAYLYCRDNGIGMTQDVVENHLLNVGNSYYVSQQFQRASVAWRDAFTPTSQFGIGILSAFMLGRRIEITSAAAGTNGVSQAPIRFSIGGLHEQFYYMIPDPFDTERIGPHGTIVKVFLKSEETRQLSGSHPGNIAVMMYAGQSGAYGLNHKMQVAEWESSLVKKVSDYVAVAHDEIDVRLRFDDDTVMPLPDSILPFGLGTFGLTPDNLAVVEKSEEQIGFRPKRPPIRDFVEKLKTISLRISTEGVEFRGLLNLPLAGFPESDSDVLNAIRMLRPTSVLIDGIRTQSESLYEMRHLHGLTSVGVINFTGSVRPQLSVDRTKITEWPPETENVMQELVAKLLVQLRAEIKNHMAEQRLDEESPEVKMIWENIFKRFWFCSGQLAASLALDNAKIPLRDVEALTGQGLTVDNFVRQEAVVLRGMRFPDLSATAKIILLGKMVKARKIKASGNACQVESTVFDPLDMCFEEYRMRDKRAVIKADEWTGECAEYDVYSSVWPVIPSRLFKVYGKGKRGEQAQSITARAKRVAHYGNSISALAEQDPVTIHPTMGIYHLDEPGWQQEKVQNCVCRFDKAAAKFWLYEINDWQAAGAGDRRCVLAVYLAPRPLTDAEAVSLRQYTVKDPAYVRGVEEGWSILVLGDCECNTVILPGHRGRRPLVDAIPKHIWARVSENYYFLDGTPLMEYGRES